MKQTRLLALAGACATVAAVMYSAGVEEVCAPTICHSSLFLLMTGVDLCEVPSWP